jgi:DNA-binding response OmpR family regulator
LYTSARPVRILLIDRDGEEAFTRVGLLEGSGWRVTVVSSLDEATDEEVAASAIIMLGAQGRLEERAARCRGLREAGYGGAVLAVCVDASEAETLLDAGADDFVTKPFEPLELVTRIRGCLRRAAAPSRHRWGSLDLDRVHRVLRLGGRTIALTARECELLACLIEAGGRVVSRANLRERVWQRKDRASNLVEVHLSRLRDKLGEDAGLIETVRSAGYRLRR